MKVAINHCWGGFGITAECLKLYNHLAGKSEEYGWELERDDPFLIQAIEKLGANNASGTHAEIHIVEIPDGTNYEIEDYDGMESIHEVHRSWV